MARPGKSNRQDTDDKKNKIIDALKGEIRRLRKQVKQLRKIRNNHEEPDPDPTESAYVEKPLAKCPKCGSDEDFSEIELLAPDGPRTLRKCGVCGFKRTSKKS